MFKSISGVAPMLIAKGGAEFDIIGAQLRIAGADG